jgi:Periplasmic component of the Tol biopolymer transport system
MKNLKLIWTKLNVLYDRNLTKLISTILLTKISLTTDTLITQINMIKRIRMKKLIPTLTLVSILVFFSFKQKAASDTHSPLTTDHSRSDTLLFPDETHFKNVQQLTFGGDNAEAYWSFDGKYIVFQRTNAKEGLKCDQIFFGKVPEKPGDKFEYKMISSGKGRCTCSFITKDGKHIIYASTHLGADTCPPVPDRSKYGNKYIWPLYDSYDIFMADLDGKIVKQLTQSKGYDAEGTLSPDGKKMIYTSDKDGDIDLYIMDINSGKEKKVTTPLDTMVVHGSVLTEKRSSGVQAGPKQKPK